jgi:hypothetical protein
MKRFALLLVALSAMMALTGCCCMGGYGGGCPGGACSPGYGAAIPGGSYYGPYGSAQVITPTYAAAPTVATQTASYTPLQSLPTY